ncbi:MAG: YkgJ family cysteine cluster protein [Verrucomicrobiota bacterium]
MTPKPDLNEAARQVRAIYAEWQIRPLDRRCAGLADCCRFRHTGRTPYLTRGEAWVAARAWRAAGRKDLDIPADGSCPFLHPHTGKCRIYDGRPFGCRTHFCAAAGGPAARQDVRDLIQRLEVIDTRLGGSGAINLPAAVKEALGWKA